MPILKGEDRVGGPDYPLLMTIEQAFSNHHSKLEHLPLLVLGLFKYLKVKIGGYTWCTQVGLILEKV